MWMAYIQKIFGPTVILSSYKSHAMAGTWCSAIVQRNHRCWTSRRALKITASRALCHADGLTANIIGQGYPAMPPITERSRGVLLSPRVSRTPIGTLPTCRHPSSSSASRQYALLHRCGSPARKARCCAAAAATRIVINTMFSPGPPRSVQRCR